MGLEFELKYRADADALERIQAAFPGEYAVIPMTTSYYDTPEGALSQRHWTLRHRREGDRQVCTLKTPARSMGRGEWECECADIGTAVPVLAELSGLAELTALAQQGLVQTCGARFTRRALLIPVGESTAELALDSGVLRNGDREKPFCEAEVELKSGSQTEILAFGQLFAAKFGLTPEPKSKFARARALGKE